MRRISIKFPNRNILTFYLYRQHSSICCTSVSAVSVCEWAFERSFFTIAISRTAVTSGPLSTIVIASWCVCVARCANVKYFSARFSCHKIVLFHFQLFLSLKRRDCLVCPKVAGRRSTNTMYDVRCRFIDDDLRVHKYLSEQFYTYYT